MSAYFVRLRAVFFATVVFLLMQPAAAQVFVNEIHYDNTGGDTGEAIEIAGAAGTDLTGWSIVRYNGNGGSSYGASALSGTIVDQQGGLGTVVVSYPSNGLQNGAPDGIALVDHCNAVVQFLSYEGSFVASGGPADGMTSTDIGVAELGSDAVGNSLQLTGSGADATDFTWAAPQASTFGAVNASQTFIGGVPAGDPEPCGGGDPADITLVINEIDYDQPSTDRAEFIELKNVGSTSVDLTGVSVQLINGNGDTDYNTFGLPSQTLGAGDYFVICADPSNTPRCDLDVSPNTNLIQNGAPDAVAILFAGTVIDAVSYEGDVLSVVEVSGADLADSGSIEFVSISRFPDGVDTNQNNVDLSLRCTTPGKTNSADSENCPDPRPPIVINELLADPASGISGDANNDGIRDSGDDEFVEIVNVTGGPLDVSGWTLADSVAVRHTFPAGSVIQSQCAIVVFGGDAPTGEFGRAAVQTASGGFLGLNNGGDSVTINNGTGDVVAVSYGSDGGDNQSLTRDPDLFGTTLDKHSTASGSSGALFSPGTRVDGSQFDGCPKIPVGTFEIFEIQGAGSSSPYDDLAVITLGNVVTAVGPDGFAMQTPDTRADLSTDTSNGIFVFTGSAPTVAVGDLVNVTGEIEEFFGFTEFTNNPTVDVVGALLPLPVVPVAFDAATPSPDPTSPSCAIEYECYEGMLVEITNGTVTGPNQRFGSDPVAEVHITAASERTFRETGLEQQGSPGVPVWDGNPEVFELDADKLGLDSQTIPAGSSFSATGIIGYEFGGYELWPTELSVDTGDYPDTVRRRRWLETTVGSLNLFRLFDDVDDPPSVNGAGETVDDFVVSTDEYQRRLNKFATYIVNGMKTPDIIGVQEVESLKVLEDLATAVNAIHPWAQYRAYLVDGNDIGGIDVGFLVRKWRVWVWSVEQLGVEETYVDPDTSADDILHDRPPLLLKGWSGFMPIHVMVVHNRSLSGIDTNRVQIKRLKQAESIAQKVQDIQSSRHKRNLVVVGDFNAFEFTDGYVDALGHIRGDFDPTESEVSGDDLVDPNLMNQLMSLPAEDRYSFIFRGNAQTLDHALTSKSLDYRVRGMQFARGNTDSAVDLINDGTTALRASDHDGFVLYIYNGWIRRGHWRW